MSLTPVDVPPFQLQKLISEVVDSHIFERSADSSLGQIQVSCAQALGSEIYVGCSNGNLLRFALHDSGDKLQSYTLLSGQTIPGDKPIDDIVLIPSLSRALILSDSQVSFYTIPSLDPCPIKPIRHVLAFAVDDHHLKRPPPSAAPAGINLPLDSVDFCIVKRTGIALYTLKERLVYLKDIPLPPNHGTTLARRAGPYLCLAGKTDYNIVNLEAASLLPFLPISQAETTPSFVKPSITIVSPSEFLILSWMGASTLGVFMTGDGDPVRGTLEWPQHPEAISLDYPYITSLLPNGTIEIHSIETQALIQVIPAPPASGLTSKATSPVRSATHQRLSSVGSTRSVRSPLPTSVEPSKRTNILSSAGGYLVPSTEKLDKMRRVPVKLVRT
ncbi:hypothetical protein CPB83DRAFT_854136 [Crepidotus variabilis]|uniref:CNH domain-containing protein n=1 Tax=Crepidotus variabilis TaxID=179855 RepID=A0A9P6EGX9_9AGAR|nr:hypothetical protein CPB83DRAFT_854136 [Crepidotus variabilis]